MKLLSATFALSLCGEIKIIGFNFQDEIFLAGFLRTVFSKSDSFFKVDDIIQQGFILP